MSQSRIDQVFQAFVHANGLAVNPDFAKMTKVYSGLGEGRTKQDLIDSIEFSGFVDGYEGRPHQYEGAVGTPQRIGEINPLDALVDSLKAKGSYAHADSVLEQTGRVHESAYGRQYDLGSRATKGSGQ